MAKRKQISYTKQCSDGRACARLVDHNNVLRQAGRIRGGVQRKAFIDALPRDMNTAAFVPDEHDICDYCLVAKYELKRTYDSLDYLGSDALYTEESVLNALRTAEKGIGSQQNRPKIRLDKTDSV